MQPSRRDTAGLPLQQQQVQQQARDLAAHFDLLHSLQYVPRIPASSAKIQRIFARDRANTLAWRWLVQASKQVLQVLQAHFCQTNPRVHYFWHTLGLY